MSAVEEGRAVANGQSAAVAPHLNIDEEYNEEEKEEEEEEEGEGEGQARAAAPAGTPTGAPFASCSKVQPKKASLNAIPFPLARVKRLIKNEDDTRVSSEATYVIAKGAGLFLEKFVEHSFDQMVNDRRHILSYKELATHVSQSKRFHFLADFVPEKVTAASALSHRLMEED